MAYKKITAYTSNKKNPFLNETLYHVEKGEKVYLSASKDPDMIIASDGEIRGYSLYARRIKVDKAQFAKIFINNIANWFGLSKSGIRVFGYIVSIVKPNKDEFYIDFEECMKFAQYKSKKTILSGLAELLENKFIARGKHAYHYFINPTIFFNGNRLTFIEQYQLDVAPKTKNTEKEKQEK